MFLKIVFVLAVCCALAAADDAAAAPDAPKPDAPAESPPADKATPAKSNEKAGKSTKGTARNDDSGAGELKAPGWALFLLLTAIPLFLYDRRENAIMITS